MSSSRHRAFHERGTLPITTCAQEKRSARPVGRARKIAYIQLLGAVHRPIHNLWATKEGLTAQEVLDQVEWTRRPAKISGADGEVVFKMDDAEVPAEWSQLATDVAVSKYFRKAGVPGKSGAEESVRQLVRRVAHTLRTAGEELGGYFATPADAETFEAELTYLLVHQIGAFNSPVWFNCGLWHEYRIKGSGGNYAVDLASGRAYQTE